MWETVTRKVLYTSQAKNRLSTVVKTNKSSEGVSGVTSNSTLYKGL